MRGAVIKEVVGGEDYGSVVMLVTTIPFRRWCWSLLHLPVFIKRLLQRLNHVTISSQAHSEFVDFSGNGIRICLQFIIVCN